MPNAPVAGGTNRAITHPFYFRPRNQDYGAMLQTLSVRIGTGGMPLTGTATTSVYVAIPASRKFVVCAASGQGYLGATGASAITAQLIRENNQGTPAATTLTSAQDITTTVFSGADNCVDIPVTTNSTNAFCLPGDTLRWEIVCVGNVTAPVLALVTEIGINR